MFEYGIDTFYSEENLLTRSHGSLLRDVTISHSHVGLFDASDLFSAMISVAKILCCPADFDYRLSRTKPDN